MASVALAHGINANLLRKWIKTADGAGSSVKGLPVARQIERTAAVPVRMAPAVIDHSPDIRLDIRRGDLTVQMAWPGTEVETLGKLLGELLR